MTAVVSPLDLVLDVQNPRFIILADREQADIREYLLTYEDVCKLAVSINEYGSLLPGERIVALQEDGHYVVIEGNRRTCAPQLLLSRDLVPDSFKHRIPHASEMVMANCVQIEVDVLPSREAALALMSRRHIEGVKEWKPLAKKQFFASNYNAGNGQSVRDLSRITSVKESEIREDIRDYTLFYHVYEKYKEANPTFEHRIVDLKTDPFWRMFKAKFIGPTGEKVSPKTFFSLSYDESFNTISQINNVLFEQIAILVFEKAVVQEAVTTRNVLSDIPEIRPLLQAFVDVGLVEENDAGDNNVDVDGNNAFPQEEAPAGGEQERTHRENGEANTEMPLTGGPRPGGPPPRSFFEILNWHGKLNPADPEHQGAIHAVNELYKLSTENCRRQKAYCVFPIATGMVLRTVYEQLLRLRLKQTNLWGAYMQSLRGGLPTLSAMEGFVGEAANKPVIFPEQDLILAYDRVIAARDRRFLNANIHYPGNINVTAESLEGIAAGGMFTLIQGIINLIE